MVAMRSQWLRVVPSVTVVVFTSALAVCQALAATADVAPGLAERVATLMPGVADIKTIADTPRGASSSRAPASSSILQA
jgi:hypothetical protein